MKFVYKGFSILVAVFLTLLTFDYVREAVTDVRLGDKYHVLDCEGTKRLVATSEVKPLDAYAIAMTEANRRFNGLSIYEAKKPGRYLVFLLGDEYFFPFLVPGPRPVGIWFRHRYKSAGYLVNRHSGALIFVEDTELVPYDLPWQYGFPLKELVEWSSK
jgi:hypothetical protein